MINNISNYRPLPSNIYLGTSVIHGMGAFAKETVDTDHDFGITHVADSRFPDGYIRTSFGGFINHSFDANCKVVEFGDTLHIISTEEIEKDSELTLDYTPYYTEEEMANYK